MVTSTQSIAATIDAIAHDNYIDDNPKVVAAAIRVLYPRRQPIVVDALTTMINAETDGHANWWLSEIRESILDA